MRELSALSDASKTPALAIGAMIMFLLGGGFGWIAVLAWRSPAFFERTAHTCSRRTGNRIGHGLTRGIALLPALWLCLGLICETAFLSSDSTHGAWLWCGRALICSFVAILALVAAIVVFNKPRVLVVPHQRHLGRRQLRDHARAARSGTTR